MEDKLDIMESFVRVTPMPIKSGEMVFLCNCCDAYKNYACVHSGVLSMLWNLDMIFPDAERVHHLKAKQKKKLLNPFDAVDLQFIGSGRSQSHMDTRASDLLCSSGRKWCQYGGKESMHGTCSPSGAIAFSFITLKMHLLKGFFCTYRGIPVLSLLR